MIAEHYIVNRYKKGLLKGRSKGRSDQHQQWLAWYERQQAAHREGRPFTEPPPAGPHKARTGSSIAAPA